MRSEQTARRTGNPMAGSRRASFLRTSPVIPKYDDTYDNHTTTIRVTSRILSVGADYREIAPMTPKSAAPRPSCQRRRELTDQMLPRWHRLLGRGREDLNYILRTPGAAMPAAKETGVRVEADAAAVTLAPLSRTRSCR
jgi:hypothetical protein